MKRHFISAILALLCVLGVYSQQTRHESPKIHVDSTGKVYINKSLPVYLFISTGKSPDSKKYLLNSEHTPQYTNPMYLGVEGRNTLRSPSAIDTITKKLVTPIIDVQYQIYADGISPETRIVFNTRNAYQHNNIWYIPGNHEISFHANDMLSGLEKTYFSIDSNEFENYTKPLVLNTEKQYQIKYYSADNTGNIEKTREILFHPDITPPTCKVEITGNNYNNTLSGNATISIQSDDNASGIKQIYYSIDDSIFKKYVAKISTALIPAGEHKLFFYASDKVNNVEATKTYTFFVDKTGPQVIEEVIGKTFVANGKEFSAGTSKLKITSFDNKAGVKEIFYSINNSPFEKYEKPIVLSGMKGNLLIKSYAVDNVGNMSESNMSKSRNNNIPFVDLSAPWVGYSIQGPVFKADEKMYINHKTKIILQAKDNESGIHKIEYQIDSSDLAEYSSPVSITSEGNHFVSVYGYDNTDNLTRQLFEVIVDTVGPEIYERFSSEPIGNISSNNNEYKEYKTTTVLFISVTDLKSGFASLSYRINNSPWTNYTNYIKGFIKDQLNSIMIKSTDKLGNTSEKKIEFYIK